MKEFSQMPARRSLSILVIWAGLATSCAGVLAQDFNSSPPVESSLFSGGPDSASAARPGDEREEFPAPEADEIETDRDSFTPATTLVTPGRFILESAYTFIDNRRTFETHSFPESVIRYGVTAWFEARLQWNFEVGGSGDQVSTGAGDEEFFGRGIERESQIGFGFKLRITEQQGWIPESAFTALGFTPTSGVDHASSFVGTYVWGWRLPRRWKLDAAFRYSADSDNGDGENLWSPSVVLKVPLWERVNVHAEYFRIVSSGKERNTSAQYFSPGLHVLVTHDFEVGFRLGWGLTEDSTRFFVNTGIGWRF